MPDGKGVELYRKARGLIPGGTQLLSKRPEMYLPEQWPAYYSRCRGAEVWDLDGKRYVDTTIFGVGACVLGYGDPDVDRAVRAAVAAGNLCTLNCPEEVELAELLISLHPWAQQVRYARCGGESVAVAVRIARAYTGKSKIAFCGYHGWHDWYLAANLADDHNLDGQLLPGLQAKGVPRELTGTMLPFNYNRFDELEAVFAAHGPEIGVIIMEPARSQGPENGFLEKVRALADRSGAVLIFDEVSSGWRTVVGGIHLTLGVNPDLAVFAKGISNGYPMGAVIGRKAIMEAAQETFISSTYWTDRIGPSAALAAIRKMLKRRVPEYNCRTGRRVQAGLRRCAQKHGLKINISGLDSMFHWSLDCGEPAPVLHTLFTQEMLALGYLASRAFYVTYAHKRRHVDGYLAAVDQVFGGLKQALDSGDPGRLLKGPVAHTGFRRLA